MRFDAPFELMVDGTQLQIILEVFEHRLDLGELDVEMPEILRIPPPQIGAQQVAPLAAAHLAQLAAIEPEGEDRLGLAEFVRVTGGRGLGRGL